jgi:tRNA(Arg) A34 adenosine deaminase TadA
MCLSAIYWSHIERKNYANTRDDAKNIDFDDSFIYSEVMKSMEERKIQMKQMLRGDALKAFKIWDEKVDKIKY